MSEANNYNAQCHHDAGYRRRRFAEQVVRHDEGIITDDDLADCARDDGVKINPLKRGEKDE